MINRFGTNAALLLIDVQKGVNDLAYYGGGDNPRRNTPQAEENQRALLNAWRAAKLPVFYTQHDSIEAQSPLKVSLPSGGFIEGLEPCEREQVIVKSANSGFVGTDLELRLRRAGVDRLVIAGFFTNFCVETTVRMAGNMGYDVYLVPEACATCNRIGPDGADHDPELVHQLSVASMHGEFCTALSVAEALALLDADRPDLKRVQGNEA